MSSKQSTAKTDQKPINVFLLDASGSMSFKNSNQIYDRFDQGRMVMNLLIDIGRMQSDVVSYAVAGEGASVLYYTRSVYPHLSAAPNAKAAQQLIDNIRKEYGADKAVNIVYLTDETPEQTAKDTREFLQELKQYASSLDIVTFSDRASWDFEKFSPSTNKQGGFSCTVIPDTLYPVIIADLVSDIFKAANASLMNKDFNKTALHGNTVLMQVRKEICSDLTKRKAAIKTLEAEVEAKNKMIAEQKRDMFQVERQLAKIDAAVEVVKTKRPAGPARSK